jgi:hypothetical protein
MISSDADWRFSGQNTQLPDAAKQDILEISAVSRTISTASLTFLRDVAHECTERVIFFEN